MCLSVKSFVLCITLFIAISTPLVANKNSNLKSKAFPSQEIKKQSDDIFQAAMDKAANSDYLRALEIIDEMIVLIPEHPAPYLYKAVITQWIIQNFRNYDDYNDIFFENIEKTLDKSDDLKRLNAWRYIYLGGAYGYRGIQQSVIGNFFSAFHDGLRGVNRIKRALELDDSIYDSYYGLGIYIFWKAYYTDQFFFLTGDPKNKDIGIKYIVECIEKCEYTRQVAERALVRIYRVDHRYQDAINIGKQILKKTPNNVGLTRELGHNYHSINNYNKAIESFNKAKKLLENHELTHPNAIVEINYNLANTYYAMQDTATVKSLYLESKPLFRKMNDDIEPMEKVREKFEELYKKLN